MTPRNFYAIVYTPKLHIRISHFNIMKTRDYEGLVLIAPYSLP